MVPNMWCFNRLQLRRIRRWLRITRTESGPQYEEKDAISSKPGPFSYFTVSLHAFGYELAALDSDDSSGSDASDVGGGNTYRHDSPTRSSQFIRLLRILPTGPDGPIACYMYVVDLNHQPDYDALSYTWGPTTREEIDRGINAKLKRPILCNGGQLYVTENLFNCLQQLKADGCYERDLWIDAVCINQEDHAERCQQVSFMDDIYRSAKRVFVWLGAADDFTKPACDLIDSLSHLSKQDLSTIDPQALDNTHNSELLGDTNSSDHWRALALLFGRSWFTRAWVIQEIVLATSTTVMCGDYKFDWDAMVAVSHFLATKTTANTFKSHLFAGLDARLLSYKSPTKLDAVKKDREGGSSNILLHSLIRCRTYAASNDHDKVYSLLGLATPKGSDCPDELYPNYHQSAARVYTDVTKYILRNVEGLHVLAHAEGDDFKHISGLPSWVPDWSVRSDLGLRITGYARFKAAGDLPCFKEIREANSLALLGGELDTISRIGETKAEVNESKSCPDWLDILKELEQEYPDRDHKDAFWRTLINNTGLNGKFPVTEPWEDSFYIWMGLSGSPSGEATKLATVFETAFMHSLNLRLFRTTSGHFGLGSSSCKEGDSIWIIKGSRVPLILRARSAEPTKYQLVGGTYIHGYMQGEALHDLDFQEVTLI
ncbi:HET-domain-containing protein [Xylariomycetidae sp. FL0641]|nr:HET-domain-containing protein [Xylariomycetidae sp. FL0641]